MINLRERREVHAHRRRSDPRVDVEGPRRYSGDGGRFGDPDERFVRIDVSDTGIGIPAEKIERVFESFYQVDNSITREYARLGLAIVNASSKRTAAGLGCEPGDRGRPSPPLSVEAATGSVDVAFE